MADSELRLQDRHAGRAVSIAGMPALHLIAIVAWAVVLFWMSLKHGLPPGNSYHYNMTWTADIAEQMGDGVLYPRWLPSTWGGAGSPDFYFYPPLFFLVSGAIRAVTSLDVAVSLSWAGMLFHAVSGLGAWRLAKSLDLKPLACVVVALALMGAPYHLLDWISRSALAELAGYAALGFVLAGAVEVVRHGRGHLMLALATMAAMLSHILIAPIAAIGCLVIVGAFYRQATLRRLVEATAAGLAGVLAASVYVVPAMLLRGTVDDEVLTDYHWSDHLLSFDNLDGPLINWTYAANAANLLVILIVVALARRALPFQAVLVAGLAVACWFMWSPLAAPIYAHTPMQMLQFPWRFSVLADFAWALAVGMAVNMMGRGGPLIRRIGSGGAIAITAGTLVLLQPPFWKPNTGPIWEPWTLTELRISPLEWLSTGTGKRPFSFDDLAERGAPLPPLDGAPTVAAEGGTVAVVAESPREILFASDCAAPCAVTFRRNHWAQWRLEPIEGGEPVALAAAAPHPLATAVLPAGQMAWRMALHRPVAEYLGWALSGFGLAAIGGIWAMARRRRQAGH